MKYVELVNIMQQSEINIVYMHMIKWVNEKVMTSKRKEKVCNLWYSG